MLEMKPVQEPDLVLELFQKKASPFERDAGVWHSRKGNPGRLLPVLHGTVHADAGGPLR